MKRITEQINGRTTKKQTAGWQRRLKRKCGLLFTAALLLITSGTALAGQWFSDENGSFWLEDDGTPVTGWHWVDGDNDGYAECFYFQENGYILKNGEKDGWRINEDGYRVDDLFRVQSVPVMTVDCLKDTRKEAPSYWLTSQFTAHLGGIGTGKFLYGAEVVEVWSTGAIGDRDGYYEVTDVRFEYMDLTRDNSLNYHTTTLGMRRVPLWIRKDAAVEIDRFGNTMTAEQYYETYHTLGPSEPANQLLGDKLRSCRLEFDSKGYVTRISAIRY